MNDLKVMIFMRCHDASGAEEIVAFLTPKLYYVLVYVARASFLFFSISFISEAEGACVCCVCGVRVARMCARVCACVRARACVYEFMCVRACVRSFVCLCRPLVLLPLLPLLVVVMLWWMIRLARQPQAVGGEPLDAEFDEEIPADMPTGKAVFWLVLGLVLLMASSRLLVWGAVNVAEFFGVSDLIIGLTIVAIGTSLPELAATVSAALKKEHEMAIGNVIGSNLFNLLAVLALPGIIMPSVLDPEVMSRDFIVMTVLTIALFLMAYGFKGKDGQINRFEGAVLLAAFIGYMVMLYFAVVG